MKSAMKNEMTWSRAEKAYLVPTDVTKVPGVLEFTHQRVTIVSFYKEGRTFYGVSIQHPADADCKERGVEQAMVNACVKPVHVISGKETQSSFYRRANIIYSLYKDRLQVVSERSISYDEWIRIDPCAEPFADVLFEDSIADDEPDCDSCVLAPAFKTFEA